MTHVPTTMGNVSLRYSTVASSVACCSPLTFCREDFDEEDGTTSAGVDGTTGASGETSVSSSKNVNSPSGGPSAVGGGKSSSSLLSRGKGATSGANDDERTRETARNELLALQKAYDRRYWLAHFVNLVVTAALMLGIELCYNWPKDSACRTSPQMTQCENPATPISSAVLFVLHLTLLVPKVFLGKESFVPVVNAVVRTVVPKAFLLDLGKVKAA